MTEKPAVESACERVNACNGLGWLPPRVLNTLGEERALEGICRARNERNDAEKRERHGDPPSTDACDAYCVCQGSDDMDNEHERANYQQLDVHGMGGSRGRTNLHATASPPIAAFNAGTRPFQGMGSFYTG
jgi:hypothetical protein